MAILNLNSDISHFQVWHSTLVVQNAARPFQEKYPAIDSFHIVISLSNRSSIEKSIKLFLKMKGQIAY